MIWHVLAEKLVNKENKKKMNAWQKWVNGRSIMLEWLGWFLINNWARKINQKKKVNSSSTNLDHDICNRNENMKRGKLERRFQIMTDSATYRKFLCWYWGTYKNRPYKQVRILPDIFFNVFYTVEIIL